MHTPLRLLLTAIFDYAGLFPPAGLPLAESAANFVRYRQSSEEWMLSRMVIPAGQLAALDEWVVAQQPPVAGPLPLSVILSGDDNADSFVASLEPAWQQLAAVQEKAHERMLANCYEVRLPAAVVSEGQRAVVQLLETLDATAESHGVRPAAWFCEAPDVPDWEAAMNHLLAGIELIEAVMPPWRLPEQNRPEMIAAFYDRRPVFAEAPRPYVAPFFFKLRTGGLEPSAVPSTTRLARTIQLLAQKKRYWKATAGLHHPLRNHDAQLGCLTHGFMNVLLADIAARHDQADEQQLVAILEQESVALLDNPLIWAEHPQPAMLRGLLSIGSCSFDEPRADLAALGLM